MAKYINKDQRVEPNGWIQEDGIYRFKIVSHEIDGYTEHGNEKHKYTFEAQKVILVDGKQQLSDEVLSKQNTYSEDEKQYWVFGNLMDALKIAYDFDEAAIVGYYFMGDVKSREYNGKTYYDIDPRSYRHSKMNENLPPVPKKEVMQQPSYESPQSYESNDIQEAEELF